MTTKPRAEAPRQPREPSDRATLKLITNRAGDTSHRPHSDGGKGESSRVRPVSSPSRLNWGVEPFAAIARELPPLFAQHWEELESDGFGLPLNPDWDLLFDMAMMNRLHVMSARWDQLLVGYIFNFVLPHIYTTKHLQAQIHLYYLHPDYRDEPGFLMRWFRANEEFLISLGVRKIYGMAKNNGKTGVIFKRLGYTDVETAWARMVP